MKIKLLYAFAAIAFFAACNKDFLNRPSQNNPTEDNYYNTAAQVQTATGFLYNQPWYNYMDKAFHCIGETLGGNMLTPSGDPNYGNGTYNYFTVQATDANDLNAWQAFYQVAGNATVLMNTLQQKSGSISDPAFLAVLNQGIAEARFIRGAAYFDIARVFGDAPIVADPVALSSSGNFNVPRYFQKDVLRFALEDFKAAEAALPETPYQAGRVTKYSAAGMEAKLYLYEQVYDSAALKANEVIQSGKYDLFPDYEGMFTNSNNNNNIESLFALQWIAGGGYSYANAIQAYAAPASLLKPDFNTGYSSVIPTLDLLNSYESGDLRKGWSIMQQGFSNPNWKNANFPNGFTYDTMPGGQPDDAYHITTGTRSNSLKYVIGPANNGTPPQATNSQGGNSMCTYILRYADVLLIYAEAVLGTGASTSDASALAAFNKVHSRAGLTPVTSLTKDGILHERRVEFAFEGDYWFDVQRQGFAKAQQIINSQERGTLNGDGSINHLAASLNSASQLYLPIPSDEVVADPALGQPALLRIIINKKTSKKKYMKKNIQKYAMLVTAFICCTAFIFSCKKDSSSGTPTAAPSGLSPDSAAGGNVLTLTGSGLDNIRSIVFSNNNVPAVFNPVFNTNTAIIFRVPDTAYGGPQNIIFTNASGQKLVVPFSVIALPTISSASIYEFTVGTQITLTGNNLDNVTSVVLDGTSDAATIISQTHKTMVIAMPATTAVKPKLDITNGSGEIVTQQQFVSVDNAYQFFTDTYGPGIQDWSWDNSSISTDYAILGTSSLKEIYAQGNWAALSFHAGSPINASAYTYFTFWVKGGTADEQVDVKSEDGGSTMTETVPANVWTYFRIPVSGFINGVSVNRMDFQMHGPSDATQTLYYDDVLLVQ